MDINILIVDDDALLVEKLKTTVNWAGLGITMVFTANNIRQAQKCLEEYKVHILLSDIEMPQGSGLELLEWVRSREIAVECIFLSSYAYFSYAQKAIQLKSTEYLLKPLSNRELEETLAGVVRRIQADPARRADASLAAARFWGLCLQGSALPDFPEAEYGHARHYAAEDRFCLFLICASLPEPGENLPAQPGADKADTSLWHFILQNNAAELLSDRGLAPEAMLPLNETQWAAVFADGERVDELLAGARSLHAFLADRLEFPVRIYVGRPRIARELAAEKSELLALAGTAVMGPEGVLSLEQWRQRAVREPDPPWQAWQAAMATREGLRRTGAEIQGWLEDFWRQNQLTTEMLRGFCRGLFRLVENDLVSHGRRNSELFDLEDFSQKRDAACTAIRPMQAFVAWLFLHLESVQQIQENSATPVEKLCAYIREHLADELSRKTLAQLVFLSEDYVSKLFAQVTGTSIPNYITRARMERAQEYLEQTSLPVSRIALEVGYNNFSYFSKNFRDFAGVTPNEFRKRLGQHGAAHG